MPINKELYRLFLSLVTVLLIIPSLALAGGYLVVTNAGVPIKWDNTSPVPFNPDGGGFGVFIANPDAVAYTQDALDDWAVIPTADLSFVNAGPLTAPGFDGDVNTIPEFFQFFNNPMVSVLWYLMKMAASSMRFLDRAQVSWALP